MLRLHFHPAGWIAAMLGAALLAAGCSGALPTDAGEGPPAPRGDIGTFTGSIRIGVVPAATTLQVGGTGSFVVKNRDTGEKLLSGSNEQVSVSFSGSIITLARGGAKVTSPAPVVVEPVSGLVLIGGKPYRGRAEVAMNSTGSLAGINELTMEQYLWGVVPRELGPIAYPQLEAQKAQAVAARTWALVGFRKRIADGYNLRATTDDQVYGGYAAEHPLSTQAVNETAGVVATYNGKPISTYYSSTSGGHTASFEEWLDGATPVPYLTGKLDALWGTEAENVPSLEAFKQAPNSTNLRTGQGNNSETGQPRYHRWNFEWTNEEISRLLSITYGSVGKVLSIDVLQRGPSGRVLEIRYVTEAGTFTSTRNRIRSSLKFIDPRGNAANLLSTLFFVEPVTDPATGALAGFKAYGGGWGHGVGMAQTSAVARAKRGATYEEILKFYYPGVELEKRY